MSYMIKIWESDFGSKKRAQDAIRRTESNRGPALRRNMRFYASEIEKMAKQLIIQMGAVDTWTLHDTIRKTKNLPMGGHFEVAAGVGDKAEIWYVVAGGMKRNPKTNRICDYAQAVHDGHSTRGGGYVVGRPFLSMAVDMTEDKLGRALDNYFSEMLKDWGGS